MRGIGLLLCWGTELAILSCLALPTFDPLAPTRSSTPITGRDATLSLSERIDLATGRDGVMSSVSGERVGNSIIPDHREIGVTGMTNEGIVPSLPQRDNTQVVDATVPLSHEKFQLQWCLQQVTETKATMHSAHDQLEKRLQK